MADQAQNIIKRQREYQKEFDGDVAKQGQKNLVNKIMTSCFRAAV